MPSGPHCPNGSAGLPALGPNSIFGTTGTQTGLATKRQESLHTGMISGSSPSLLAEDLPFSHLGGRVGRRQSKEQIGELAGTGQNSETKGSQHRQWSRLSSVAVSPNDMNKQTQDKSHPFLLLETGVLRLPCCRFRTWLSMLARKFQGRKTSRQISRHRRSKKEHSRSELQRTTRKCWRVYASIWLVTCGSMAFLFSGTEFRDHEKTSKEPPPTHKHTCHWPFSPHRIKMEAHMDQDGATAVGRHIRGITFVGNNEGGDRSD